MTTSAGRAIALAAALLVAAACGGDLTLPDPTGAGFTLAKVGGDGQTGTVGEELPLPVVVRVLSGTGKPVVGQNVLFSLPEGETGKVTPAAAQTNADGEATARWELGTVPGEHALEARLPSVGTEAEREVFAASAKAASPDTVRAVSALFQPGRRGQTLEAPLVVALVDRFGNPVPDTAVEWRVVAGGGQVSADETRSAADGTASVSWTLGGGIGVQKVTATVAGATGSPVTFSATVLF